MMTPAELNEPSPKETLEKTSLRPTQPKERGRRGSGRENARRKDDPSSTQTMEQMLWGAACSIRGEKDAAKFKDYLLPLLFLKRLSDVFDDEINRLEEEYGNSEIALKIAESDHQLLRFYIPPEARWGVISGRDPYDWGNEAAPRDCGEQITKALRALVRENPSLSGVIDVVDFAAERNGERDINPSKLRDVIETFSDTRYRLGLNDVQPDFLGRAYEYLLRKFVEGSGDSAGEFFTPTEVGFLMAYILDPKPGETCHDYACGSGGLLIKMQLVAKENHPQSTVPLKLSGQELQAESFALARMNAIIHDMDVEFARGDTMMNPKFLDENGRIKTHDIVVANPMWNQSFEAKLLEEDRFDRFSTTGGAVIGKKKGDWSWLQHTFACLGEHGRAAVVLDTGAVTRGSGEKKDKERAARKWFVDNDVIDGVILLPDNLFYNTTAAGVIVLLNKNKPAEKKGKITLLDASACYRKGRPKNYLPQDSLRALANQYRHAGTANESHKDDPQTEAGEQVDPNNAQLGRVKVITLQEAAEADYNLSPSRWVDRGDEEKEKMQSLHDLPALIAQYQNLEKEAEEINRSLHAWLAKVV